MKTIAISNQKGGVGKTTTAVSLSVALARQGKRVLLIDADSQADATKYLGVENPDELQNTLSTAIHSIINDLPYKAGGYIQSHPEGLDFVPSSIDLSSVEVELVNAMSRERILKTFLDDVRGKYDYVLIDCPPSLGMMPINALSAADSVLIPVQSQYFSMRGLLQLIRTIDKVQRRQNPRLKIEGIVLTLVDNRTNLSRDVSAMLRDAYGANVHIFKTEIPMCVRAAESPSFGKSIFDYDPRGKATMAYEQLAREVLTLGRKKELGRGGFAPTR